MKRSIKINITAPVTSKIIIDVNGDKSQFEINKDIEFVIISNNRLEASPIDFSIECTEGEAWIGKIQFDKVFIPNPNFLKENSDIWDKIIKSNFDFSVLNDYELDVIHTKYLFVISGENEFGGHSELRINPRIDGILQIHSQEYKFPPHKIYVISKSQKFACDLTLPKFL